MTAQVHVTVDLLARVPGSEPVKIGTITVPVNVEAAVQPGHADLALTADGVAARLDYRPTASIPWNRA